MAVKLAEKRSLPRANVRDPDDPFPDDQYVKVPNVAIFAEHETKTPEGQPQRFDQDALQRLIDRGNERIETSGDYAAVCVGHTHDPDDVNGAEEQPEVIGAMGPYRLGLLGHPGTRQKYAILADLWIRKDKIDKYNAHPRRSVELWYEHDQPAWIDPLSLLTEAPRLDLGLTPLIPTEAGSDGAELKYLYAATFGGLRRVKYAAGFAAPSASNVFVPAETSAPRARKYAQPSDKISPDKAKKILGDGEVHGHPLTEKQEGMFGAAAGRKYAAGDTSEPASDTPTTKDTLMLAPEDVRQICDAIEQLDVIAAMREFAPMIPRLQEMLEKEDAEHAAMEQPGAVPGEEPPMPGAEPPMPPPGPEAAAMPPEPPAETPPAPPAAAEPPAEEPAALPEDLEKVKHSADAGTTGKSEEHKAKPTDHLKDMSEEDIERYLCSRNHAKYAAAFGTADGKEGDKPAQGDAQPGPAKPEEGSASGDTQKARYSALEAKLAELEADRITRTNQARAEHLRQLRYHRSFNLDKEIERVQYGRMNDAQFSSHCELLAEVATPTLANQPMPIPDELLDSKQPLAAVRQGPEKYTKEKCEEAARVCYEKAQSGKAVSYELVLDALVNGRPVPE